MFNQGITSVKGFGITLTTLGITMQTSCIKKIPSSAYHKTDQTWLHTLGFLMTTTLVRLRT
jgi:hypothetical protein